MLWNLVEMELSFLTAILLNYIEDRHEMFWIGEFSSTMAKKINTSENWKNKYYYEFKVMIMLLRWLGPYLIILSNSSPFPKVTLFLEKNLS